MKTCTKCGAIKAETDFGKHGKYRRNQCKACQAAYAASWYEKAKANGYAEKNRQKTRDWYDADPERGREKGRRDYQANKSNYRAKNSRRRAAAEKACPAWADPAKIKEFYVAADFLGMATGEWHHVDHIVPLQSHIVCGLHVEHNLQVLASSANLRKSNRHWPDMP